MIGRSINRPDLPDIRRTVHHLSDAERHVARRRQASGEMAIALNSTHMKALEERSSENTTTTAYEAFVAEEFIPRFTGKPRQPEPLAARSTDRSIEPVAVARDTKLPLLDFWLKEVYKGDNTFSREVTMSSQLVRWDESTPGVKILRLWQQGMTPEWPRIVVLDLAPERFREFENDVLAFDKKYNLYPDQPMLWISGGARPPVGRGLPPMALGSSHWRVVLAHKAGSSASYVACPHD